MSFPGKWASFWLSAIAVLAVFSGEQAFAEPGGRSVTLDDAQKAYEAGDFRVSLIYCNYLLAGHPSALAHYYRANALVKLGQVSEAKTEYEQARHLSQDDYLRRCCDAALATFELADGTAVSHYKRANALFKVGDSAGARAEYESALLSTKDPLLQKYCFSALAAIPASVDDNTAGSINVVSAPSAVPKAAEEKAVVTHRISLEAHDLGRVIVNSNWWSAYNEALGRADELTSTSESLQTQLAGRRAGGIHLLEQGTDLFVRNYASNQTIYPAHAWIGDAASYDQGQFTTPLEATPQSLDEVVSPGSRGSGRLNSRSRVFGKILYLQPQ